MSAKYSVGGKEFRFRCDVQEWSWQLCRAFQEKLPVSEDYSIREIDDMSYGVVDKKTHEVVHKEKVKILL